MYLQFITNIDLHSDEDGQMPLKNRIDIHVYQLNYLQFLQCYIPRMIRQFHSVGQIVNILFIVRPSVDEILAEPAARQVNNIIIMYCEVLVFPYPDFLNLSPNYQRLFSSPLSSSIHCNNRKNSSRLVFQTSRFFKPISISLIVIPLYM